MSRAKAELKAMELRQDSFIHGYHVIWNAALGQVLLTKGELARAPTKRNLRLYSMFIDQGGDIAL